jgi:HAD superfamily hydrolase (TIGR01509 family)
MDLWHIETVVFDVDGTLTDSNRAHAGTWTQAFREQGVAVDEQTVRRLIGMGGDKLIPAVAHVEEESETGKAIAARKKELFTALMPTLGPTRGARELLEYLRARGIDLVIATSADDREVKALLIRAGVDELVPVRSSKDDADRSKPDPDIVQAALTRAQARPELTLMVGDTPYDVEAARKAGIDVVALRCGGYWSDQELRGAVEIFDDPAELLAHWRELALMRCEPVSRSGRTIQ